MQSVWSGLFRYLARSDDAPYLFALIRRLGRRHVFLGPDGSYCLFRNVVFIFLQLVAYSSNRSLARVIDCPKEEFNQSEGSMYGETSRLAGFWRSKGDLFAATSYIPVDPCRGRSYSKTIEVWQDEASIELLAHYQALLRIVADTYIPIHAFSG